MVSLNQGLAARTQGEIGLKLTNLAKIGLRHGRLSQPLERGMHVKIAANSLRFGIVRLVVSR